MDRTIVYPGSIPLDTDLLSTNRNTMVALGALLSATLAPGPLVDGLGVTPAVPASLAVNVAPGSLTQTGPLDQSGYGSLPSDITDNLAKMGINISPTSLSLGAPTSVGTVVSYLIQATFQELDVNPVVLPYYNAANPTQPFMGAANNGLAQPTLRAQKVALQAKAGVAAAPGANVSPSPDPGWVGLAFVSVANGQSAVTSANIAPFVQTRTLGAKLGDLRSGTSQWQVFNANGAFVVPQNVSRLKVRVVGGGAAGGTHSNLPSGGGGGGATARGWLYGVTPGTVIPVTVGSGGLPANSPGNGGNGGTSSFGSYMSATGGLGGFGGTANLVMAGGQGGTAYGGDLQWAGSCGTDAIPATAKGGDGGGAGSGRGTSGFVQGFGGLAPGAGGGGGGASAVNGSGQGAIGGNGFNGVVIVEY